MLGHSNLTPRTPPPSLSLSHPQFSKLIVPLDSMYKQHATIPDSPFRVESPCSSAIALFYTDRCSGTAQAIVPEITMVPELFHRVGRSHWVFSTGWRLMPLPNIEMVTAGAWVMHARTTSKNI